MTTYKIIKINVETEEEIIYGCGYTEEDVRDIVKSYKFNGLFYERANSKYILITQSD